MPSFRKSEDGVRAVLEGPEADLLASLPQQLRDLVGMEGTGVHERLFPRAYLDPTEEEAERRWQQLVHEDLLAGKLAAAGVVSETLARGEVVGAGRTVLELSDEEAAAWLGALNDLRLALGVMLEVTEDLDPASVPPDDPRAAGLQVYGWLTWMQGELIDALAADL